MTNVNPGTSISLAGIAAYAQKFVGAPYVYGGTSPSGWDCSGFVQYVLEHVGYSNVPRTSEEQWAWVTKIQASQLQPGDLVFAQFPGDNASPGHVGIYTGNGKVLSAQDPALGTGYASLSSWAGNIVGYGAPPGSAISGSNSGSTASGIGTGILGGLLGFPTQITQFFQDADTFVTKLMWLENPSNWLRIGAFLLGVVLLLIAIGAFIRVSNGEAPVSKPQMPTVMPVPI